MEKGNLIMMIGGIIVLIFGIGYGILTQFAEPVADLNKVVMAGIGTLALLFGIAFGCLLIGSALFKYEK